MAEAKRSTMADIARLSGFSKASVSFAFNQPDKISRDTYEKIMAAARELDYLPDPIAQNLSKGKMNVIGFLLPQSMNSLLENPYSMDVMKGIGQVCEENGSNITIIPPLNSSIAEAIKTAMVDGIITMGCTLDKSITDVIRRRHLPVVSIDGNTVDGIVLIQTDDEKAAETQMTRALELGHRDFVIVALRYNAYRGEDKDQDDTIGKRLRGYRKALQKMGLKLEDQKMITVNPSFDEGEKAAEMIFREAGDASCIICMADILAYGIMNKAEEMNISIPGRYSLIGFDGIDIITKGQQKLTTIMQPGFSKGKAAAEELFREIDGLSPGPDDYVRNIPFTFEYRTTLMRKEDD